MEALVQLFVRQFESLHFLSSQCDPLSYTILLEDLLGIKKCPQKHGGSDAIAMTTVLVPRFMATTTVPTAILSFRQCTSPPWFQPKNFVFEVKISLKILIFLSQFAWFTTDTAFLRRSYVWELFKQELEEYFYSQVRFLYLNISSKSP
jgi:hypothetical protein